MGGKTYFIDVDGTIVNYLTYAELDQLLDTPNQETLLPGVKDLWNKFNENDYIIITTARYEKHRSFTENIFKTNGLRFDLLIMNLPNGPRILINDTPHIFKKKAIAINVARNGGFDYLKIENK